MGLAQQYGHIHLNPYPKIGDSCQHLFRLRLRITTEMFIVWDCDMSELAAESGSADQQEELWCLSTAQAESVQESIEMIDWIGQ